jgi:hypothetical protein
MPPRASVSRDRDLSLDDGASPMIDDRSMQRADFVARCMDKMVREASPTQNPRPRNPTYRSPRSHHRTTEHPPPAPRRPPSTQAHDAHLASSRVCLSAGRDVRRPYRCGLHGRADKLQRASRQRVLHVRHEPARAFAVVPIRCDSQRPVLPLVRDDGPDAASHANFDAASTARLSLHQRRRVRHAGRRYIRLRR